MQQNPESLRNGLPFSAQIEENLRKLRALPVEAKLLDLYDGSTVDAWIAASTPIQTFFDYAKKSKMLFLDDDSIYTLLVEESRGTDDLFQMIQNTLGSYFEHQEHTSEISRERKDLFYAKEDPPEVSIRSLKKRSVCIDKALVAHNLFHALGLKSTVICSDDCKVEEKDMGNHSYLVITDGENHWLYDPENTNQTVEEESVKFKPSVYPLTKIQYEQILRGEKNIEVEWVKSTTNGKKERVKIIYGVPIRSREEYTRRIFAKMLKQLTDSPKTPPQS